MEIIKFNSVADFKRQAQVGRYVRGGYFGKHQNEWREIEAVQSRAVRLRTLNVPTGGSWLNFPKAKDVQIEDGKLKIFEERVKWGNTDSPATDTGLKWYLERGKIKENELIRYTVQVAEYELGEME